MDDSIDEGDALYDQPPPPGPSLREVRAGWARDGDVESLWALLTRSRWDAIDQEDVFKLLIQALEVRGRDPERFAADVFARMAVFTSTLLLRCHLHLGRLVEGGGRALRLRAQPPGDLPRLAVESLIPRVVQLQEHVAALLLSQASVARQWGLVRRNRAGRDRPEADRPGEARGQRRPAREPRPRPEGRGDGRADDRHAASRNGRGAGVDGAHRDG